MKTPVNPDPERDEAEMDVSYAEPQRFDDQKLFPGTQLEFQRPTKMDVGGFIGCFALCFGFTQIWNKTFSRVKHKQTLQK